VVEVEDWIGDVVVFTSEAVLVLKAFPIPGALVLEAVSPDVVIMTLNQRRNRGTYYPCKVASSGARLTFC